MNKKNIAMILSVVMTASVMLAGCGKKAAVPAADSTVSSSATGETATGESATPETSTETVTVDYGVGLKKNGYFKGVKAKKLVTLPADYANIQIPRDELDLKDMDASVTSTISQITSSYGDRVKVERPLRLAMRSLSIMRALITASGLPEARQVIPKSLSEQGILFPDLRTS